MAAAVARGNRDIETIKFADWRVARRSLNISPTDKAALT
jgi:hypothetical protein